MAEEQQEEVQQEDPDDKHLNNFISQLKEMNDALKKQIDINLKKDEEIAILQDKVSKNDIEIDYRDKTILKLNNEIDKKEREIAKHKKEKIFINAKNDDIKLKNELIKKKHDEELKKKQEKMSQELNTTMNIIKKGEKINSKTLLLTKSMVQEEEV